MELAMPTMPGTFRAHGQRDERERRRDDDRRRGSARQRGYTSRWDKASKVYLARHPLCLGCRAVGVTRLARVTDHTVPHRGDDQLFWNSDNWQSCCAWHHDVVKQRLEAMFDDGSATVADLRLDSDLAKRLTRQLAPHLT